MILNIEIEGSSIPIICHFSKYYVDWIQKITNIEIISANKKIDSRAVHLFQDVCSCTPQYFLQKEFSFRPLLLSVQLWSEGIAKTGVWISDELLISSNILREMLKLP